LTRLFSAALYYHFSFLSISLALLGAGAGGILVYVRPAWFSQRPLEQELARWSAVLAGLLVVVPLVVVRIRFAGGAEITMTFTAQLGLLSLVTTTLFGAAGTVIALAVRGYTHSLPRLYAFDLAGAALGAVVMVPLMWAVPVPVLVIALSPVAAIAGLLFASVPSTADQVRRSVKLGVGALAVGVTALVAASTTGLYRLGPPIDWWRSARSATRGRR
jgi:hypothetical protein